MGNWYCKCGHRMSDGQSPTPHGYEVYTSKQRCDGGLDEARPYADAYICPECGRLMIFSRDSKEYMLYEFVPNETLKSAKDEPEPCKTTKVFSDEAWDVYSRLSEKEDEDSAKTVKDINSSLQSIQDDGVRELSVRNKLVGPEHQICYRVHDGRIEIISIEWIFE